VTWSNAGWRPDDTVRDLISHIHEDRGAAVTVHDVTMIIDIDLDGHCEVGVQRLGSFNQITGKRWGFESGPSTFLLRRPHVGIGRRHSWVRQLNWNFRDLRTNTQFLDANKDGALDIL